ncbi:MAG: tripartite tricarboxylate transporter substrate binding protein [Burkholderiaceae bacterium]|nr:tripartite tricarboxylate transporter substrate binding protein [Burkholderiaceae bacterium]
MSTIFARTARSAALGIVAAGAFAALMPAAHAQWKPTRPVTIIVPWAAGGATDQVTRLAAAELEAGLGQKVVVINQPGGAGSIGTKAVLDAPRDGYTWTAGAAKQLGTYPLLGMIDSKVDDFHLFLAVTNVSIVSVNPGTPYKTFPELLEAMKTKQIPVGTAGNSSSGHFAMEAITQATGAKYRHVTYDGGNPAVVSTVSGETEVTTQLAPEQVEMIKGKRLRPLVVVGDQALEIDGVGTIPPITQFVKDFPQVTTAFGIYIPKGAPPEVVQTVEKLWAERVAKSERIRKYAAEKGALFTPLYGKAAYDAVWPTVVNDAYLLQAAGMAKVSPESIGIRR